MLCVSIEPHSEFELETLNLKLETLFPHQSAFHNPQSMGSTPVPPTAADRLWQS